MARQAQAPPLQRRPGVLGPWICLAVGRETWRSPASRRSGWIRPVLCRVPFSRASLQAGRGTGALLSVRCHVSFGRIISHSAAGGLRRRHRLIATCSDVLY